MPAGNWENEERKGMGEVLRQLHAEDLAAASKETRLVFECKEAMPKRMMMKGELARLNQEHDEIVLQHQEKQDMMILMEIEAKETSKLYSEAQGIITLHRNEQPMQALPSGRSGKITSAYPFIQAIFEKACEDGVTLICPQCNCHNTVSARNCASCSATLNHSGLPEAIRQARNQARGESAREPAC